MKNDLENGFPPGEKKFNPSVETFFAVIILIPALLIAGYCLMKFYSFRTTEQDSSAQQTLRNINSAQAVYESGIGGGNYASNLALLGGGTSKTEVGLIDSTIVNAQTTAKSGYLLGELKTVPRTGTSTARYSITMFPAVPTGIGRSGRDCFYIDETGIIRHSGRPDVPATASSPPIGN